MNPTAVAEKREWNGHGVPRATATEAITATVELITPAMAEQYLARNIENRVLRPYHVAPMRRAMEQGQWELSGEAIKFSATDVLLDGQHRLEALVESGRPQLFLVVRGLPDRVRAVLDSGLRRQSADRFAAQGELNVNRLAGALTWVHLYLQTGAFRRAALRSPSHPELQETLRQHPGIRDSVSKVHWSPKVMQPSLAAAMHYLMMQRNPEVAAQFWADLADGAGLRRDDAVYQLRERLLANRTAHAKLERTEIAALVVKAWNARVQGVPVGQLRWRTKGKRAEEFPTML